MSEPLFRGLTFAAAVSVVLVVAGIFLLLLAESLPALGRFGVGFITSASWNPVTEKFGALPAIFGTLVTSCIAMLIAVPLAFGSRSSSTNCAPTAFAARWPWGSSCWPPSPASSTACGACSSWRRSSAQDVEPVPDRYPGHDAGHRHLVPGAALRHRHADRRPDPRHHGLPFIASVAGRCCRQCPAGAARGRLRRRRHAVGGRPLRPDALRQARADRRLDARPGPSPGRNHGGHLRHRQRPSHCHASLLAPGTTISATLANEFTEAVGDIYLSVAGRLGLILFVITFAVLAARTLYAVSGKAEGYL